MLFMHSRWVVQRKYALCSLCSEIVSDQKNAEILGRKAGKR